MSYPRLLTIVNVAFKCALQPGKREDKCGQTILSHLSFLICFTKLKESQSFVFLITNGDNSESESTDSAHSISATWPFSIAVSYDVLLVGCVHFL